MYILSQNFKEMLKNRLESKIKCMTSVFVEDLIKSFSNTNGENNYLDLMSKTTCVSNDIVKEVIIELIKEFDESYRNSPERKREYYVNKKNVPRTITTIVGDITFTRTLYETKNKDAYYFYIDELLHLPQYDHYDPIVKGLAIRESFYTSQAQAGRIVGERITNITDLTNPNTNIYSIPRQIVNRWLKDWSVTITYDRKNNTPKILYIMVDEKFIGSQDLEGDIMGKAFVVFEGVKEVGKNRRALVNRHIFTCYSNKPWEELLDRLVEIYEYDKIEQFYVLSDGGNWITSGINELKLESFQKVEHLLCLFHFKQAINHITTDKKERVELFNSFINDKRRQFKNKLNNYIEKYPHKKETITKKIKYLLNHYQACKRMVASNIGSSMESHISHFIASTFSSRPKGYSSQNINKYFMLNDAKINGINLFNTYLQTYDSTMEKTEYKESQNNDSLLNKKENLVPVALPYMESSNSTPIYQSLSNLTHVDSEIRAY